MLQGESELAATVIRVHVNVAAELRYQPVEYVISKVQGRVLGFRGVFDFDALRDSDCNDWVSELRGTDFGFEKSR